MVAGSRACRLSDYRDFVLTQRCVRRGSFPEDTLGKQMLNAIKRDGLAAAAPYAAFLWDDEQRECARSDGRIGSLAVGSEGREERTRARQEDRAAFAIVGHLNGRQ